MCSEHDHVMDETIPFFPPLELEFSRIDMCIYFIDLPRYNFLMWYKLMDFYIIIVGQWAGLFIFSSFEALFDLKLQWPVIYFWLKHYKISLEKLNVFAL